MRLALLAILAMAGTVHAAPASADAADPADDDEPIGAQLIIGGTIGVIAMGAGAAIGYATEHQVDHCTGVLGADACAVGISLGAFVGATTGAGAGIALIGNSNKARGSYAAAIGGSMAGMLIALGGDYLVLSTVATSSSDLQITGVILGSAVFGGAWLGGGLLGYELSRHSIVQDVVLVPVVQPGGGGLSFAGRF